MGNTADNPAAPEHPWTPAFGGLSDLHDETKRIERIIEDEFERIDDEDCR